eukprot:364118-Chlamydomonas_euryale.AAC.3
MRVMSQTRCMVTAACGHRGSSGTVRVSEAEGVERVAEAERVGEGGGGRRRAHVDTQSIHTQQQKYHPSTRTDIQTYTSEVFRDMDRRRCLGSTFFITPRGCQPMAQCCWRTRPLWHGLSF